MEPNESALSTYYHHRHNQQQQQAHHNPTTTSSPSPINNGLLSNNTPPTTMVFPHSVVPSVPVEAVRRKRGRPRKYGTPEQAAAAKRLSSSVSTAAAATKKDHHAFAGGATGLSSSSAKKSQLAALGSAGHGFTPHIISVAVGEDVGQKIMLFMQQSKREICILSASGSISNASLRQPAKSGGSITYEGRFDIISLTGSYVHTVLGGKTGGLSVCLSSTDGQIIGGGVGGPLTAAGPIQVIIGAFLFDSKKDIVVDVKTDTMANKLPSAVGAVPVSSAGYRPTVDSLGSQFTIQPRGMQITPPQSNNWGVSDTRRNVGYDFSGDALSPRRIASGAHEFLETGDYDHISDRD